MHKMSFSVVWMSRKFLLEMRGGVKQPRVRTQKRGVCIKRTCAYEGGGGGQILAILERTY